MRFLRDASKLSKLGNEIDTHWDRRTSSKDTKARTAEVRRQLDGRVTPVNPRAESINGTARVLVVGPTGPRPNEDPVLAVELLVMMPGRLSRTVKTLLVVPMVYLDILTVGATLPIRVPVDQPDEVSVNWAALGTRAVVGYQKAFPTADA